VTGGVLFCIHQAVFWLGVVELSTEIKRQAAVSKAANFWHTSVPPN
jgi:hypothetical protein